MLNVVYPLLAVNLIDNGLRKYLGGMSLGELEYLLCNQSEMTHVAQPHVSLLLSLIARLLTFNDPFRDSPRLEKVDGK